MTDATVDEVLGAVFYLIVAVLVALTVFASAIVGLMMLNYLADIIDKVVTKFRHLGRR